MQPPIRRPWILPAGGNLIDHHDPIVRLVALQALRDATNIPDVIDLAAGQMPTHLLISTPVAVCPLVCWIPTSTTNLPRLSGLAVELAWLPIFWLPETVATPYKYVGLDGVETLETTEEWHYRASAELEAAGLWNSADGTWVDVLATYAGIDIATLDGQTRVRNWLAGGEDDALTRLPEQIAAVMAATPQAHEDREWATVESDQNAEAMALIHLYSYADTFAEHARTVTSEEEAEQLLEAAWVVYDEFDVLVPDLNNTRSPFNDTLNHMLEAIEGGQVRATDLLELFGQQCAAVHVAAEALFRDEEADA